MNQAKKIAVGLFAVAMITLTIEVAFGFTASASALNHTTPYGNSGRMGYYGSYGSNGNSPTNGNPGYGYTGSNGYGMGAMMRGYGMGMMR